MRRHNSLKKTSGPLQQYDDPMRRVDPFQQYPDVFKQIIDWSKDPMVRPENQNKYFFSDGKTYYEQICKMLKLMSVFKEAFQQIYDNEDEIHEAWNNFVDNLTATAEYGEEVAVSLTWTDDSVNFDFTIPGGEDGVGIQSIVFNVDYTMTITLTDGTTYTSPSLRGETGATGPAGPQGPTGPQGPQGEGLNILDVYPTLADLQQAHPTGSPGDAYEVGSAPTYILYIWSSSQNAWVSAGSLGSVAPSNTNPLMDGTASAGISDLYSRGDHVHPTDTSRASQSDLNTVSGNLSTLSGQVSDIADAVDIVEDMVDDLSDIVQVSQSLPDQQFLYRESLADHDTIGRLDSIKGNTVVFNQLVQNGNFASTSGWSSSFSASISVSNNKCTLTCSTSNNVIYMNQMPKKYILNHKYLIIWTHDCTDINNFNGVDFASYTDSTGATRVTQAKGTFAQVVTITTATDNGRVQFNVWSNGQITVGANAIFENVMLIDLTELNNSAITDASSFRTYYNLPYYDYTQGKLLSFKGESLKTTGKNLTSLDSITTLSGGYINKVNSNLGNVRKGKQYTLSFNNLTTATNNVTVRIYVDGTNVNQTNKSLVANSRNDFTFTASDNGELYLSTQLAFSEQKVFNEIQLEFGSSASSYEPYTSSTINLPVLEHFPTGMKSAGTEYDEKTESKAITRIGNADIDDFSYGGSGSTGGLSWFTCSANSVVGSSNLVTNYSLQVVTDPNDAWRSQNPCIVVNSSTIIRIYDSASSLSDFKLKYPNLEVYYELATTTEQSISPALDMTFKAWKGGTEQILPENTSDPYTAPIRTDMTYMSTDEAVLYLKDHAVTDPTVIDDIEELQDDVSDLQTDVGNLQTGVGTLQTDVSGIQTQIGSESTTPMTGILGRLNTAETDITALENVIDSYYSIQTYTFTPETIPYPAGSQTATNVNAVTVPGYRPIGVIGWDFYNLSSDTPPQRLNASYMALERAYYLHSTGRIYVTFANNANYAQTNPRLDLYVLYMKVNGGN